MPRDFIQSEELIARKPHRCEWCGLPILPGTRHSRTFGRQEGEWVSARAHLGCEWLMYREVELCDLAWDEATSMSVDDALEALDVIHDGVWAGIASGPAWEALSADERERMNLHAQGYRDAVFGRIDEVICA